MAAVAVAALRLLPSLARIRWRSSPCLLSACCHQGTVERLKKDAADGNAVLERALRRLEWERAKVRKRVLISEICCSTGLHSARRVHKGCSGNAMLERALRRLE